MPAAPHIIDHPLVQDMLADARDKETQPAEFRRLLARIGGLIAYEATRDLATDTATIDTPLESAEARRLRYPVTIIPILRAGLGMADGIHDLMPHAQLGHIGLFRDEATLQPVPYYERLPDNVADGPTLLIDPMLATGGSAIKAVDMLVQRGCNDIRLICLVAAPEGVKTVNDAHPNVPIYTASLDRQLNDIGYILPGLGDAGDRLYGTL